MGSHHFPFFPHMRCPQCIFIAMTVMISKGININTSICLWHIGHSNKRNHMHKSWTSQVAQEVDKANVVVNLSVCQQVLPTLKLTRQNGHSGWNSALLIISQKFNSDPWECKCLRQAMRCAEHKSSPEENTDLNVITCHTNQIEMCIYCCAKSKCLTNIDPVCVAPR